MSERPDLDRLATPDIVALLLSAEERVIPAVREQGQRIAAAADLVAARLRGGGRLLLVGAGTSGRLAVAESAELPGTFGLDRTRVVGRVAGGAEGRDVDEDDLALADSDLAALAPTDGDVLVAVSASGATPYTLAFAAAAVARGAAIVAVVTSTGSPLARLADLAVEVEIGPEVLRGSTRLTAGTAQKVALNALTTAAMVRLGRVHGDVMIDVEPTNAKLRGRAAGIVADVAGCSVERAAQALDACNGNVRAAVTHLVLELSPDEAAAHSSRFITLRESLGQIP
jgi:N-acetylmuramic acid 6-phosphate etherase